MKKLLLKILSGLGLYRPPVDSSGETPPLEQKKSSIKDKYKSLIRQRGVHDWKYEDYQVFAINQDSAVRKLNRKINLDGRMGLLKGVWRKMTKEEKEEYANKTFKGPVLYKNGEPMVILGTKAYKRLTDFENKMNDKYIIGNDPINDE